MTGSDFGASCPRTRECGLTWRSSRPAPAGRVWPLQASTLHCPSAASPVLPPRSLSSTLDRQSRRGCRSWRTGRVRRRDRLRLLNHSLVQGDTLPITAFNSFSDGLAPNQRSREHFIANIDLEDGPHWVPYADGVWIQLCHFNVTSGRIQRCPEGPPWRRAGHSLPHRDRSGLYDAWSVAVPGT